MLDAPETRPLDPPYTLTGKRVWVAGHRGMVGQALLRRLGRADCTVLTAGREAVDLRRPEAVDAFLADGRPQVVVLAAATVGGIRANDRRPAEFLYDNLAIATQVIDASRRAGVEKLLVLGSACIYPRLAEPPVDEAQLLAGPLEPTNQWYALAKIAAIKLAQAYRRQYGCDFIAAIPANLYGPHDNFDPDAGHVVPGLLRRMHEAKRRGDTVVTVWGSGRPRREFLHVDDLADALVHLLEVWSGEAPVNVGAGTDVSIAELARLIRRVVGYEGQLAFDPSLPDGAPRRRLDVARLSALGWRPRWDLEAGLRQTSAWLLRHWTSARV